MAVTWGRNGSIGAALVALMTGASTCACSAAQRQLDSASDALSCARAALASDERLGSIASMTVTFEITPDPSNNKGRPSTTELTLGFPDRFKAIDRILLPDHRELIQTEGFAGARQFVSGGNQAQVQDPNDDSFRVLRSSFARWALVLLMRETSVKPLTWSRDLTFEDKEVRISATGADDFNMTLLLDKSTCRPLAAMWTRASNLGDALASRAGTNGRHVERWDLLDYTVFDGIRLPMRIRATTDGMPRSERTIISARVNVPLPPELAQSPSFR